MAETTEDRKLTDNLSTHEMNALCDQVVTAIDGVLGKYGVVTQLGILVGALASYTIKAMKAGVPLRVVAGFYEPVIEKLEIRQKREETKH